MSHACGSKWSPCDPKTTTLYYKCMLYKQTWQGSFLLCPPNPIGSEYLHSVLCWRPTSQCDCIWDLYGVITPRRGPKGKHPNLLGWISLWEAATGVLYLHLYIERKVSMKSVKLLWVGQEKKPHWKPGGRHLDFGGSSQPPELWRKFYLFLKPHSLWYFAIASQTQYM